MEEIKKEIRREVVETEVIYRAIDGTEFSDRNECLKYESSAVVVLLSKTIDFTIAKDIDAEWFDCEDENENLYKTLVPRNNKDIEVLNQLWVIHGGKYEKNEDKKMKFSNKDIGKVIHMGYRYQNDTTIDWVWFYTFDYMIESLTNGKYILIPNPGNK